jgi:hypothetical protein
MAIPDQLLYFAYGSNMHPQRLRLRVPSSQSIGAAILSGYQLRFHKRGHDASGKCNIWRTDKAADQVIGVVYRMSVTEKPLLDAAEGLGQGYQVVNLPVQALHTQDTHHSFCYLAETDHIDETLQPFSWYHDLVVQGAYHHGLPDDYIARLDSIAVQTDQDSERHALHQRILAAQQAP